MSSLFMMFQNFYIVVHTSSLALLYSSTFFNTVESRTHFNLCQSMMYFIQCLKLDKRSDEL